MKKEEIKEWLKNNSEKTSQEIEKFLLSEMNGEDFKEYWHKHYFLEGLKSPTNNFSREVLNIISNVQKKIDNNLSKGRSFLANFVFGIVGIFVWGITAQVVGIVFLVITALFTENKDVLKLIVVISQLVSLIIGIWMGNIASRWVKNYKKRSI